MTQSYTVTLSSKGQLTLPADVRRTLAIDRGVRLRLVLREDGTIELAKPRFARVADVADAGAARPVEQSPAAMRENAHADRWLEKAARSR